MIRWTYFTQNKAVKGSAADYYTHINITYRFASRDNLEAFKKNPERYEPEYGGQSAHAMGDSGKKVGIDPETFQMKERKLYLFYHSFIINTLPRWISNAVNLHKKANANCTKFE
jgi:YHS domain-containing protein